MGKGKFAVGALVGAAAGLIAGILTAPKSGKQTRADIKEKAAELKSDASKKAGEAKTKVDGVMHDAKDTIASLTRREDDHAANHRDDKK